MVIKNLLYGLFLVVSFHVTSILAMEVAPSVNRLIEIEDRDKDDLIVSEVSGDYVEKVHIVRCPNLIRFYIRECTRLNSVDLSYCPKLEHVIIDSADMIETILFVGCKGLALEVIDGIMQVCRKLKSIDLNGIPLNSEQIAYLREKYRERGSTIIL